MEKMALNGNKFLLAIIVWLSIFVYDTFGQPITNYIRDTYLHIDAAEVSRLADAENLGLLEIKTVILPEGENLWGNNFHFGWPVAAMHGNNIVVCSRRKIYHSGCGSCTATYPSSNDSFSGPFYVRSTDRGQTWGPMIDLVPLFENGSAPNAGGMSTIGVNDAGDFIIPGQGVLRSNDGGVSWGYYQNAFAFLSQPNEGLGPSLINHPVFEMLLFNGRRDTDSNHALIRRSINGWYYWYEMAWDTTVEDSALISNPKEPAALTWGPGHIVLLSREWNTNVGTSGENFALTQHVYEYQPGDTWEDITFVTKPSGILAGPADVWAHDTASACYNPVTGRIEAIDSARYSGPPPDYESGEISTLNIWSIDPDDLLAGSTDWRYDGTLLERNDRRGGCGHIDGLHPGGSVIDTINGVEHIFIYAGGEGCTLNGIFQITRTLDTPALSAFCKRSIPTGWESMDVGNPALNGSAVYWQGNFRVRGCGEDVGGNSDQFRFVCQQMFNDGSIMLKVNDVENTNSGAKAGVMIRNSLDADSAYGFIFQGPDGSLNFQYRTATGTNSEGLVAVESVSPIWLRIIRTEDQIQSYYSQDGSNWSSYGDGVNIFMNEQVYIGMAVCSHNAEVNCEANFENVMTTGVSDSTPLEPLNDCRGISAKGSTWLMDLNKDCAIDFNDFADFLAQWLFTQN